MNSISIIRSVSRIKQIPLSKTPIYFSSVSPGFNKIDSNVNSNRKSILFGSPARKFHCSFSKYEIKTIQVPPFAESVTEGDVKWLKNVGDHVAVDEVIGEIETDKTTVPIPSPCSGVIVKFLVNDADKVNAKQDIVQIDTDASVVAKPVVKESPKAATTPSASSSGEVKTINVPPFAESVTEGDIRWLKNIGDTVNIDDVIGEIETDKTTVPVPAPVSGIIKELLVSDGSKVTANQEILRINVSNVQSSATKELPKPTTPVVPQTPKETPAIISGELPEPGAKLKAITPTSKVESLEISHQSAATSVMSGNRGEQRVKMNRMRQRIAQRLKDSQNTCAMLTTFNEIDMSNLIEMRNTYKDQFLKKHGIKFGIMSAFTKASAYALMDQPVVNAVIDGQDIVYRDYVDISIAVATPKGLVVPVLRNCETMNYLDIERGIGELGEKAKKGKLSIEDIDNGTFTISNGGVFGSLFGTPIINPPQSAILGMHGSFDRPVVRNGQIVIRPMMYVALTYDHRLIDGREAVTFLRKIKSFVEDPRIFLLGL